MGRHRTRLNILSNILSVISSNKGAKKTRIMYQAYLSYKLLTRYLTDVLKAGLVICEDDTHYLITQKGEKFLAKFGEYYRSREDVEKQLDHVENQRLMLEAMCPNTIIINGDTGKFETKNTTQN